MFLKIYLSTGTGAANNVTVTNYDSADHGTVYLGHASGTSQGFSVDASNTSTLTVTHASATGSDDTANLFLPDTNNATGTTSQLHQLVLNLILQLVLMLNLIARY